MHIQIVSDIHLEFEQDFRIEGTGDVLVLAGDICIAKALNKKERNIHNVSYYTFFDHVCERFKNVIYVMGNHEHYKGTLNKTADVLREGLSEYNNLHLLDNESIDICGTRFIGSTLWANCDITDPVTAYKLQFAMNDYKLIKYIDNGNYRKLKPEDTYREHKISAMYLENALANDIPCVVITHHAPSMKSIHKKYANDKQLNTLYASDMEYLMTDNVKLWIHGHTHNAFDYTVGNTRVVCNPAGYPFERSGEYTAKVVEV